MIDLFIHLCDAGCQRSVWASQLRWLDRRGPGGLRVNHRAMCGTRSRCGAEKAFQECATFVLSNDPFTKTGSGHIEKVERKRGVFRSQDLADPALQRREEQIRHVEFAILHLTT